MTKLLTTIFLFTTTLLFAQTKTLDTFFAQVRAGKYPNIPAEVNKPESATALLNALPVYLKDTMVVVRSKAAAIARNSDTFR